MKKVSVIIVFLIYILNFSSISALENQPEKVVCSKFNQSLKYTDGFWNDKNIAVLELQQALVDGGYMKEKPDGSFGSVTLRAVTLFQRKNDLLATGFVGEKTREVLKNKLCQEEIPEVENTEIANNCRVWSDGCNTCTRVEDGTVGMCTLMACVYEEGEEQPKPSCKEYFPETIESKKEILSN